MARYIDSEQVVRELFSVIRPDGIYGRGFNRGIDIALAIVNRQDTADVVEVKHGHWIKRGNEKKCSVCAFVYYSNNDEWNGCPNCLAKMDGGS